MGGVQKPVRKDFAISKPGPLKNVKFMKIQKLWKYPKVRVFQPTPSNRWKVPNSPKILHLLIPFKFSRSSILLWGLLTLYTMFRYRTVGARSRTLLIYEENFCVMSSNMAAWWDIFVHIKWSNKFAKWWNFILTRKQVYGTEQHGSVQLNHVTYIPFYIVHVLCTGPIHRIQWLIEQIPVMLGTG